MSYELVYQGNLVEIFKISESLYFRKANLPIRNQCNGAFIVGDREVAIVDAPPGGIEMLEEAERLFHKPVTALYLTHGHEDHADGLAPFLDHDLTVYCNYRLLDYLIPCDRKCRADFIGVHDRVDIRLSSSVDIELFILNDVAHSKGDMFVRIPALELICTGDCVVEYQTAYFHSADIHSWVYSLKKLSTMKGKYILPGHNPELLPYSYIDEFAMYLSTVEKCAKTCFARFHSELANRSAEERFASVSSGEAKSLVEKFFDEGGNDALFLEERAGKTDARRAVRMVLWEFIRGEIR